MEPERLVDNWERSNRMCLMVIKCTIREALRVAKVEEATRQKFLKNLRRDNAMRIVLS